MSTPNPVMSFRIDPKHRQALKVLAVMKGVDVTDLIHAAVRPLVIEGMELQTRATKPSAVATAPGDLIDVTAL